jgi:hypothetical protein
MKHVKTVNLAAGLAAALALALSACGVGGGDEHNSTATSPSAANTSSPAASMTTTPQAAGSSTFCTAAKKFETYQAAIHMAERAAAQDHALNSAAVLSAAKNSESTLTTMEASAPASLKTDMQAAGSGWKPFFDTLISAGGDMSKVPAGVESGMQATVKQPPFIHVDQYEAQACHFQPSAH